MATFIKISTCKKKNQICLVLVIVFVFLKGHFIKTLGKLGDKETENEVILAENDILHHEFSEAVLDCLPTLPWTITDKVCFFFFMFENLFV